jgi:pimeloyl-ACP methyl ester carboxylesterase
VRALRGKPELLLVEGTHAQPPADRLWTALPWVRADEIQNLREAFRQGALAYAQDISLLARPWGFAVDRIDLRVQLWHGDADRVIPLHHAKYLASELPDATLQICPDEGHMLLWNHTAEFLRAASGAQQLRLVR